MILVRDVFRMKFGRAKQVKEIMKEAVKLNEEAGYGMMKVYFDLVGKSYTCVFHSEFNSLADYEKHLTEGMKDPKFGQWYQKFCEHMESAYREIFTEFNP